MPKLESLELEIVQKSKTSTTSINNLAKALTELAKAGQSAESLNKASSALAGIAAASEGLKSASGGINQVANALKRMGETLGQTEGAVDGLKRIAEALNQISTAANGLNGVSNNIRDINHAATRVIATPRASADQGGNGLPNSGEDYATVEGTGAVAETTEKVEALGEAAGVSSDKIDRMREALAGIDSALSAGNIKSATDGVKDMAKTLNETSFEQAEDAIRRLYDALETGNPDVISEAIQSASNALRHLPGDADTASNTVDRFKASVQSTLSSIGAFSKQLLAVPWNRFKKNIKGTVGGLGQLFSSFKRIAMYRALRTAIKAITQGFAIGVKHLYAWSDLVGNSFKQSMDSLSTSANYLKNSLGAMVSPIIDALAPAVEILVDRFVDLLNAINQFFATVTGATTWRKAVKQQKEYAANTDSAAAAQKKLNHQLMAFDELNNITSNQPSGGGSGSNKQEVDDGSFVTEALPDWAKGIKEAIEKDDWYGAGALLADKLNGMLDEWDAEAFGKKIGTKFQHGIDAYLGFMQTFNWNQLGIKSADFVNGLMHSVNAEDLGKAIVAKMNAALQFLAGFTSSFEWDTAGKWLADVIIGAFTGLDWGSLGKLIKNLATGLLDMLKAGISELAGHGGEIISTIGDFFSGLGWDGLFAVGGIVGLTLAIKNLFSGALLSGADSALAAGGAVETGIKTAMGSFAARLGTIALVVGFTWFVSSSHGLKEPTAEGMADALGDEKNPALQVGKWFDGLFGTGYSDEFMAEFTEALKSDADVIAAYNKEMQQLGTKYVGDQGAANAGALEAALSAFKYKQKFKGAAEHDRGYKDPDTGWVDWFPSEIDTTQQVQAIAAVGEAAANARKKVHELPPTDDEVSRFQDQAAKQAGSKGTGLITQAAINARNKVKELPPADDEVAKFQDAATKDITAVNKIKTAAVNAGSQVDGITPTKTTTDNGAKNLGIWETATDGIKTAAKNAGTQVDGIAPTAAKTNSGKSNLTVWKTAANGIKDAAEKAGTNIKNIPTSKKITFTDASSGLKNASNYASVFVTNTGKFKSKYTFTVNASELGNAADDAKKLYQNLNNINSKSWRIQVTGDMKLKMVSEKGNAMYFVEPMAQGGLPDTGQLFLANEAGPELIGTINGKTAVSSNQEITGIADAVYDTGEEEAALLREQNQLLRQLLAKNTSINLAPNVAAGRWVAQASNAYRKATGG